MHAPELSLPLSLPHLQLSNLTALLRLLPIVTGASSKSSSLFGNAAPEATGRLLYALCARGHQRAGRVVALTSGATTVVIEVRREGHCRQLAQSILLVLRSRGGDVTLTLSRSPYHTTSIRTLTCEPMSARLSVPPASTSLSHPNFRKKHRGTARKRHLPSALRDLLAHRIGHTLICTFYLVTLAEANISECLLAVVVECLGVLNSACRVPRAWALVGI